MIVCTEVIVLENNNLTGPLRCFSRQTSLRILRLEKNRFTGTICPEIGLNLKNLSELVVLYRSTGPYIRLSFDVSISLPGVQWRSCSLFAVLLPICLSHTCSSLVGKTFGSPTETVQQLAGGNDSLRALFVAHRYVSFLSACTCTSTTPLLLTAMNRKPTNCPCPDVPDLNFSRHLL